MFINISHNNPDPLYKQVSDSIKNAINSGELKPNEYLPSIRNMAKELKISIITVKRAYKDLEDEGLIITRPGLGSFVANIEKDKLKQLKIKEIEEVLKGVMNDCKKFNISLQELIDILKDMEGK